MNKIYTFLVTVEDGQKLEKLLNIFRVGLNDWDKSKRFVVQGYDMVNYTILTNEETFKALVTEMNAIRTY